LIERSLREPEVFGVIFDRHFDAVYRYLARRIGVGRADDLAASTFTVAFERRESFRLDASTARPWLFGIATNLLRNERRAEKRALEALGSFYRSGTLGRPSDPSDPSDVGDLGRLLGGLDREQRDVLLLYAWEELSYEEIAQALSIPVGTVRSRLARARARLRAALSDNTSVSAEAREVNG
jgi:RNA polymerase sigma factor (sigma-70 family)